MRRFEVSVIAAELVELGSSVSEPVTAFMIGGGAMGLQGLKDATKDLDLVLRTNEEMIQIRDHLTLSDYRIELAPTEVYKRLGARVMLVKEEHPQWDLFVEVVCGKLSLSPGMITRARRWHGETGDLDVRLVAPEDIFVFKSITERPADRDDMDVLFKADLRWEVVLAEMRWQSTNSQTLWGSDFHAAMKEFAGSGHSVPILADLEQLAENDTTEWAVRFLLREGPLSSRQLLERVTDQAAGEEGTVAAAVKRLTERGQIHQEEDLLYLVTSPHDE